jgi:OFA family oxalate/formate antiporter-like MFS transporter
MNDDMKILGLDPMSGRWLRVAAGLVINLCLGAIYAYSVIRGPLETHFKTVGLHVTATDMQLPFMVFLLAWAVCMPLAGPKIDRWGPRRTALAGGLLLGSGWFLASLSGGPKTLAVMYGLVGGAGVGLTYGVPLAVSARWFPDKRGLAVGLTILGFGLSAAIVAPLSDALAVSLGGILGVFRVYGLAFFLIIAALSRLMTFPPEGWTPRGWTCEATPPAGNAAFCRDPEYTRKQMLGQPAFYGLWICYALGALAGLMAIGVAKPVGLEVAANAGLSAVGAAGLMTSLIVPFATCNGCGRPLFGAIIDRISPKKSAVIAFGLIAAASILLYANPDKTAVYVLALAILWGCLGGWVAIAPAATARFFGARHYSRNYGIVFTAYGAGAVFGNVLAGRAKDVFGSYLRAFPIVAGLAGLGIVAALALLHPPARIAAAPRRKGP